MKVIFMGTPEFAVPILEKILTKHEVVLVVTQPDSVVGRKREIKFPPVKELALEHNLEVFQPVNIQKEEDYILSKEADIIITAAYGQIIGKRLLNHFKYKSINVHGSLLPKYRGGAPIQWSLINGDQETGITIMYMAPKMDAGDILRQEIITIEESDNQETLFKKLSLLASEMILPFLDDLEQGLITPTKQEESLVTYAYNISKEDELLDFTKEARDVFNHIRGLCPNPGAYTKIDNKVLKIYDSIEVNVTHNEKPGTILEVNKDSFVVACGNQTSLAILDLQLAGRNRMSAKQFLNGAGRNIILKGKFIGG